MAPPTFNFWTALCVMRETFAYAEGKALRRMRRIRMILPKCACLLARAPTERAAFRASLDRMEKVAASLERVLLFLTKSPLLAPEGGDLRLASLYAIRAAASTRIAICRFFESNTTMTVGCGLRAILGQ
jgi:hypothetical protein